MYVLSETQYAHNVIVLVTLYGDGKRATASTGVRRCRRYCNEYVQAVYQNLFRIKLLNGMVPGNAERLSRAVDN